MAFDWVTLANFGVPTLICGFLLVRIESAIQKNTEAIEKMAVAIATCPLKI